MDEYKEEDYETNEKKSFSNADTAKDTENDMNSDESQEIVEFTGEARTHFLSRLDSLLSLLQNNDPYFFVKGMREVNSFLAFKDNTQAIQTLFDSNIIEIIIGSNCNEATNLIYETMCQIVSCSKEFCDRCMQCYLLNRIVDSLVLFDPETTKIICTLLSIIFEKSQLSLAFVYSSPLFEVLDDNFTQINNNDIYLSIAHIVNNFLLHAKLKPTLELREHDLYLETAELEQFFEHYDNSSTFLNEDKIKKYQTEGVSLYPKSKNTHVFNIVMHLLQFCHPEAQEIFSLALKSLSIMIHGRSVYYDDVLSNSSFISMFNDLDFLFSLDIQTNKNITKVLDSIFSKIEKTINIQLAEHIFMYLLHWCVNTDDVNFYDCITSTIINLLVCFSGKHSFQNLFTNEFIEILKDRIFNSNFKIKENSLLLFMRLASEFDSSIITEDIMSIVISFLDPLSPNFSIAHLLLNDLYVIFFDERNAGEEESSMFNMFLDNGGADALDELVDTDDNKKVQKIAEKILDEFINDFDVVLNLDDD